MMRRIFLIEHKQVMKQKILWIELAALAVIIVGMYLLLYATTFIQLPEGAAAGSNEAQAAESAREQLAMVEPMITWPGALVNALGMAGGGLGGILIIIFTGAVVSQEFHWRTLHQWLARGVPRPVFAGARFLSLLLPSLLIVLAALLSAGAVSLVITAAMHGTFRAEQVDLGQLALSTLRTAYTLLPYAGLAFLLAVVTHSAVASIGIGLTYALLFESLLSQLLMLVGGMGAELVKFLPVALASSLMQGNSAIARGAPVIEQAGMTMLPEWAAALGVAIYTLAFVGLAILSLRRQDLAG